MLLIGNPCITDNQAHTQMAIWSIVAAPLIMGNDVRNMTQSTRDILLNRDAIAINQDKAGLQGGRITPFGTTEVWARNLSDGSVAVALLNKGSQSVSLNHGDASIQPPPRTLANGQPHPANTQPLTHAEQERMRVDLSDAANASITVTLSQLGITAKTADVYNVWAQKSVGTVTGSYTTSVPAGGTAFVRITPKA